MYHQRLKIVAILGVCTVAKNQFLKFLCLVYAQCMMYDFMQDFLFSSLPQPIFSLYALLTKRINIL